MRCLADRLPATPHNAAVRSRRTSSGCRRGAGRCPLRRLPKAGRPARLLAGSTNPVTGTPAEASDETLQLVIPQIVVAVLVEIGEAALSRRSQRLQPGRLARLAFLDQAQALAEHLAGILIAAGADEGLDDALMVGGQDHVAGRHGLFLGSVFGDGSLARIGRLCQCFW